MNVKQGNTDIPSGTGFFNFGSIPLHFAQSITFTIENTGIHDLILMSYPLVKIMGSNTDDFTVSSNTTKKTIPPNTSTDFSINFCPRSLGKKTATISILNNDNNKNPYSFVISGTCTAPAPEIHIKQDVTDIMSVSGVFGFGTIKVNETSNTISFTIENNGNEQLELTGNPTKINIIGNDASMFIADENSTRPVIAAMNSTTFKITFKPTSAGIKTAKISILNTDSDENPYTFTIQGTGIAAPEINLKKGVENIPNGSWKFDFDNVLIDESSTELVITIENLGTATLHLTSPDKIEITGIDASMFSVDNTTTDEYIKKGDSTTFSIKFNPTSAGQKKVTVSIENNDDDENPYTFTLEGKCVEPEINIKQESTNIPNSTGTYDFGLVYLGSSSQETTFTIENSGLGALKLTGSPKISVSGTNSAMFIVNETTTSTPVHYGSSTTFTITFTPTSDGNNKTATISIANNDTDENPYTFTITGDCEIPNPEINIKQGSTNIPCTTGSYDFGLVYIGTSNPVITFNIENLGTGDLNLTGSPKIAISGTDSSMFAINESGTTSSVPQGSSTTFKITFKPTSLGNKTSTISIENDDNDENPYIFKIKGVCSDYNPGSAIGWIGGGNNGWKTVNGTTTNNSYMGFNTPSRICTDCSGNLYIADRENSRICKWDKDGNAIGWIGGGSNGWKTGSAPSIGSDYKSFYRPTGIAIDTNGDIYIADTSNHRICKWDKNGNAIGWIGDGKNGWQTSSNSWIGTDYKSFYNPLSINLDSNGNIFVADAGNYRISKWDKNGNAIGWIGGGSNGWKTGSAPHSPYQDYQSFYSPYDVSLDSSDNIYVADNGNHRICKWDSAGNAIGWIGAGSDGWKTSSNISSGSDYRSFYDPRGVFVTSSGDIYIAERRDRICKWNSSGYAVGWIGGGSDSWKTTTAPQYGSDYQSFNDPFDVYLDQNGFILVADTENHRICKWKD